MMRPTLLIVLAALATSGCDEQQGTTPAATNAASEPAKMTDAQIDAADIPVAEDFENEAAEQITADSLDDEVAKLASEIEAG